MKSIFTVVIICLSVCAALTANASAPYYQYRSIELEFTGTKEFKKPWLDVDFTATFKGPRNTVITLNGFWDGDLSYKIRFAPTLPGEWKYMTVCKEDAALNGKSGTLSVLPAAGDNPLYRHGGFIKASGNGRYLTYTDGTPFFFLGDTWSYCPSEDYMPFDKLPIYSSQDAIKRLAELGITTCGLHSLEKRKQQRFTVIYFGCLGTMTDGVNLVQDYYKQKDIKVESWKKADKQIQAIVDAGLVAAGTYVWVKGQSLDEWKVVMKYMHARWGAYPTLHVVGMEYNALSKRDLIDLQFGMHRYIKSIDAYGRAASIQPFPWNIGGEKRDEWDENWLDYLMLDTGHEDPMGMPAPFIAYAWMHSGRKAAYPLVATDLCYEGITRNGFPPHSDYTVRFQSYRAWQFGCRGETYGANGIWYPTQHKDDQTFWSDYGKSVPWWEALELPGAQQLSYLRKFYETINWWKLAPCYDAIPTSKTEYYRPAAASIGDEVITVYFPRGAKGENYKFIMEQKRAASVAYDARWFNPRTGVFVKASGVKSANGTIALPVLPDNEDWLLLLEAKGSATNKNAKSTPAPFRTQEGKKSFTAYCAEQGLLLGKADKRNVARTAVAKVSSYYPYRLPGATEDFYIPQKLNDGSKACRSYDQWSNDATKDPVNAQNQPWAMLEWPSPVRLKHIVLYTMLGSELRDFEIQYKSGGKWHLFADADVTANALTRRVFTAKIPIDTTAIRVLCKKGGTKESITARIVELEAFTP